MWLKGRTSGRGLTVIRPEFGFRELRRILTEFLTGLTSLKRG